MYLVFVKFTEFFYYDLKSFQVHIGLGTNLENLKK